MAAKTVRLNRRWGRGRERKWGRRRSTATELRSPTFCVENDPRRGTAAETEDARNDEGGSSGRRDGHEARTLLATSLLRTRRGPAVGSARASARYRFEFDPALKLISTPDQKTRLSSVAAFEINSKTTGLFQILFCAIFYILFYVLLCALVHIPVFHSMFY